MMLVSASLVGCVEDTTNDLEPASEEESSEEEEEIEPVGEEANEGMPHVSFVGFFGGYYSDIAFVFYDDGFIISYTLESTSNFSNEHSNWNSCSGLEINSNTSFSAEYDCFPLTDRVVVNACYDLVPEAQTLTAFVEDNDGNLASANYSVTENMFDNCEEPAPELPSVSLFNSEDGDGVWSVDVVMVAGMQTDLCDFLFYLKDESGSTYVGGNGFGEICMKNGDHTAGIDLTYSGNDPELVDRRDQIIADDDGSEYPVQFSDNDGDGKLSAGDKFTVYGQGNAANGPADDGWKLMIQYHSTGDIVGYTNLY